MKAMTTSRTFELRTYHAVPGKLDELHARFRNHTIALWREHGFDVEGFFTPTDVENNTTLVYLLSYPTDRAGATALWESFRTSPEWTAAKAASEVNGPLVDHLESVFLAPTDYSPLR
jgi:hypothetical protein